MLLETSKLYMLLAIENALEEKMNMRNKFVETMIGGFDVRT